MDQCCGDGDCLHIRLSDRKAGSEVSLQEIEAPAIIADIKRIYKGAAYEFIV